VVLKLSLIFIIIMSVRKVFEDAWHEKFPETPVPTNLSFLDDEGVSSLATALDSSERIMKKLEEELSRQQFIYDFVLQRLNVSIAARSDRRSISPSRRGIAVDERRKTPISKTPSAPRPGQHIKPSKAAQLAAVMAKIGIGKVNRPAIDPEDEGSLEDSGQKATPVSRFYDKSNMYRASSEPSLLDLHIKFKPQPAIPPTTTSRMPAGFKPIFTKDEHNKPLHSLSTVNPCYKRCSGSSGTILRKSTGSDLDCGHHQLIEEPTTHAEKYLETDLDSIIPPTLTPPPRPPPLGEAFKLDMTDAAGTMPPRTQHSHIYEEPMEFERENTSVDVESEADEGDEASSDEEPLYFNILLFKQQTLNRANALYTSANEMTASSSSENEKTLSEQRRLRRMAHHYEHIEPKLSKRLSVAPDSDYGKQIFSFILLHPCLVSVFASRVQFIRLICDTTSTD